MLNTSSYRPSILQPSQMIFARFSLQWKPSRQPTKFRFLSRELGARVRLTLVKRMVPSELKTAKPNRAMA